MSADATAPRGLLVVFEGPEGVGKTTQVARLAERLQGVGVPCERFREPGGTPLGDDIRSLVLHSPSGSVSPTAEALLFMAARAQLVALLRERLAAGSVVLLDRFFLSTYAYQIAGRGLPADGIRQANALATGGLTPDLTLLFLGDPTTARARMVARGELDRMEREDADFHGRVAAAFGQAAEPGWQGAHREVGPVARIDADGTVAEVGARVEGALRARWPETFNRLSESQ